MVVLYECFFLQENSSLSKIAEILELKGCLLCYWGRRPKAKGGPYCHEQCFICFVTLIVPQQEKSLLTNRLS